MPPLISLFVDRTAAAHDTATRAASRWLELASTDRTIEILTVDRRRPRAVQLASAIKRSTGRFFAWIDASLEPDRSAITALADTIGTGGAATGVVVAEGGLVQSAGATLTRAGARVLFTTRLPERNRVLFAPAGVALYDRAALLEAGGVYADFVHGHEDADAGWRLALSGRPTIVDPAVTFRQRAAAAAPPDRLTRARLLRHSCANELRTLITCAPDEWLPPAIAAWLARQLALAGAATGIDPSRFTFGGPTAAAAHVPVEAVARLLAVDDVVASLGVLRQRRDRVQAARKVSTMDLDTLFEDPVDTEWMDVAGEGAAMLCDALQLGARRTIARQSAPGEQSLAAPAEPSRTAVADTQPTISIVVLTALGATHLPACLMSLAQLTYPRDRIDLIIVDNASPEDPTTAVAQYYPGARVLRQPRNLGFCGGNDAGVRAARGEWVLFLNDDTRVAPDVIERLLDTARRREAACVGAFITNWEGDAVDFAGSGMNFEARGFQRGAGRSDVEHWRQERPVLFANGAAMLIDRRAFDEAGGFPEEYFAYYEDVALGWALWLRGQQAWISADANVRHLHHGTSARSPSAARVRHCERNALYTLFTHASEAALADLLGASLTLASERVVMGLGVGGVVEDGLSLESTKRLPLERRLSPRLWWDHVRAGIVLRGGGRAHGVWGTVQRVGARGLAGTARSLARLIMFGGANGRERPAATDYETTAETAAALAAVLEWSRTLPALAERRRALQTQRVRTETEIVSRFPDNWLDAVPVDPTRQPEYNAAHRAVIEFFRLRRFLNG